MNEQMDNSIALADPASEATKVEQTRAIAEVQGALVVAQQQPRDTSKAHGRVMESCKMQSLAEKAFFSFPRAGKTVTGESIHLATELARCWGNIDYGIKELSRDDDLRTSEMLAFAWDLETNTRAETTFIVPHRRGTRRGTVDLTDVRDVYENNANMGARRVREMIFRVLPPWLVEDARAACHKTLQEGGGVPIEKRRSLCIQNFGTLGITEAVLAEKINKPMARATDLEIANLGVTFLSIKRGEINADDFAEGMDAARLTEELEQESSPDPHQGEEEPPSVAASLPEKVASSPDGGSAPAGSSKGRTPDFESGNAGSSPAPASTETPELPIADKGTDTPDEPDAATQDAVVEPEAAKYKDASEMIDVISVCQNVKAVENSINRMNLDDLFPPDKDLVLAAAEKRKEEF